jgi:hypothetical protein
MDTDKVAPQSESEFPKFGGFRGCLKSIICCSYTLEDPPQPPLKRGEPDPEVPLFKGDLGGSSRNRVLKITFQTTSKALV